MTAFVFLVAVTAIVLFENRIFSQDQSSTEIYFADHISPTHQIVIDEFNRLHEGTIRVIPVNLPFEKFSTNERKELLARSLRSKSERLDVFAVDLIWVPRFARWAEPLETFFPPSTRQHLIPAALQSCFVESTLVAMPMYLDVGMLYYRRDIIRRLPDAQHVERRLLEGMTWAEIEALRPRLGYQSKPFYVFQAKEYEGLVCNFFEMARGFDRTFPDDAFLRTKASRNAVEILARFVRERISPPEVLNCDENLSYRYALDNDAVFVRGWPNFLENFRSFYRDSTKLAVMGRAPLPFGAGPQPSSVFGGWNLMISKTSKKKEAAAEFIRFVESDAVQRILFERGGYLPVQQALYHESLLLRQHPELELYRGLLEQGFHRPALADYTRISDIIAHCVHRAIEGEWTPTEALGNAEAMIQSGTVVIK